MHAHEKADFKLYRNNAGEWCAIAQINTPAGPVTVVARASEAAIRRALTSKWAREVIAYRKTGAVSGGFFGSLVKAITAPARHIFKAAKSLAKGDVMGALRGGIRSAMALSPLGHVPGGVKFQERMLKKALPIVAKLAPIASMIPGLGMIAGPALMAGTRLLTRAYAGQPRARRSIRAIRRSARRRGRRGSQARRLSRQLGAILRLMKRKGMLSHIRRTLATSGDEGQAGSMWKRAAASLNPAMRPALRLARRARAGDRNAINTIRRVYRASRRPGRYQRKALMIRKRLIMALRILSRSRSASSGATPVEIVSGDHGSWTTANNGQQVFTPHAYAGGPIWDNLKPRLGYRPESEAFGTRDAYHDGIEAISTMW